MLKKIYNMPAGTLGFEAIGEVDDDDVEKVLGPALRNNLAAQGKLRLLYVLGPRLEEYEGDAVSEHAKFVARHLTGFERVAVVSDEEWLRPAIKAFSVLLPGEAKAFPVRQVAAAKSWLAEGLDASGSPAPASP